MNKVIHGKMEDAIVDITDNSVDLIATDPPYGMNFMGKDWDKAVPSVEQWEQCYRVLKDGSFMFVQSAPRLDLLGEMERRIRAAGFLTSFTPIYWTFACLSEDTEILTKNGFKRWNTIQESDEVCSLDIISDGLVYEKYIEKYVYEYDDQMVNIKNKNTDQLLTPNHKVILKEKSNGRYNYSNFVYKTSDDLIRGRKCPYYLLPLARKYNDMSDIGSELRDIGLEFTELLGWIISEGHFYRKKPNTWDIRIYPVNLQKVERIRYLLKFLKIEYSEYTRNRSYKERGYIEHCFYINNKWKYEIAKWIPNKKPIIDLLFLDQKHLHSLLDGLIGGDGCIRGKNYVFYQKDRNVRDFVQILATHLGYRTSIDEKKMAVYICWKSDTEIQKRSKLTFTDYKGKVWCVQTKYNNFVARRNGKVFITGNSGFPKAHNISLKLDRIACQVELEKELGRKPTFKEFQKKWKGFCEVVYQNPYWVRNRLDQDNNKFKYGPSTDAAKQFEGAYGGFQPKPAVEVIIVAQKPMSEKTFCEQVLKNGKGVIWFDDGRIPYVNSDDMNAGGRNDGREYERDDKIFKMSGYKGHGPANPEGRFPANLLSQDDVLNDGKMSKSIGGRGKRKVAENTYGDFNFEYQMQGYGDVGSSNRYFDLDFWFSERIKKLPLEVQKVFPFLIVAKPSTSEKEKGLENFDKNQRDLARKEGDVGGDNPYNRGIVKKANDHPTVKPIQLYSYLIVIGSRENEVVLDPFCGSGTTLLSAKIQQRKYIGIEMAERFCRISQARLKALKSVIQHDFFEW